MKRVLLLIVLAVMVDAAWVLSSKVCKSSFYCIFVLSIFLCLIPPLELVYFLFVCILCLLHGY